MARLLQQSQAEAARLVEKLLKAGVQQAVQDASLGGLVDLLA